jgi:hypothetical protein
MQLTMQFGNVAFPLTVVMKLEGIIKYFTAGYLGSDDRRPGICRAVGEAKKRVPLGQPPKMQ